MLIVVIRSFILFALVVIVMRVMGKRQVGQLQPYELVITIIIAELAALPMQDIGLPLMYAFGPLLVVLFSQMLLSFLGLKNETARKIICGTPSVVIENGKIVEKELERLRINMNDLMEQLRIKNSPNIADVEFAIMETNGQLSVIPKSQKRPINPNDLNIGTLYEGLSMELVENGNINYKNLDKAGLSVSWLEDELKKRNISNIKEVFYVSIDSKGKLYYQMKFGKEQ